MNVRTEGDRQGRVEEKLKDENKYKYRIMDETM
jgi:hypothetical protein